MRIWLFAAVLLGVVSCASIEDPDKIDVSELDKTTGPVIDSVKANGQAKYSFENADRSAEWISCHKRDAKSSFLVVNRDEAPFEEGFCKGWVAQAFLKAGYSVIGVNRPGYGKSSGERDFAGKESGAALEAVVNAAPKSQKDLKPIVGVWGYGSGAIAAAFVAKKTKKMQYLVLGGGIFDAEVYAASANGELKKSMEAAMGKQEPSVFFEARSIAWDTEGLPKTVLLYHGKQDTVILPKQSEAFRDTLASAEFNVKLNVLDDTGHEIDPAKHRAVLISVLAAIK